MNKPSILLISIDTLRVDHLSCYGYQRATTTNIDCLAEDGVRFMNAYSAAVWTPPAHASMLTGLYPSRHGVIDQNKLADSVPTLAQVLQQEGYQTCGFVNNSQVGELVGLDRGHDDFHEIWIGLSHNQYLKRVAHKLKSSLGYLDSGAAETNRRVTHWFDNSWDRQRPFYMFLHYLEPHNPLGAPHPFRNRFVETTQDIDQQKVRALAHNPLVYYTDDITVSRSENERLLALYDGEIAYIDHKIGEVVARLRALGVYDNTLIVLTADHGEHFGEHGHYSHVASLYEEIVHIPMCVKFPSSCNLQGVASTPVQHVDLFPTVLDILGTDYPGEHELPGKSLVPKDGKIQIEADRAVFAEWEGRIPHFIRDRKNGDEVHPPGSRRDLSQQLKMIRRGRWKYIMSSSGSDELYDIEADNCETTNLAKSQRDICSTLRAELILQLGAFGESPGENSYEMNDKIKEHLKALGYL